MDNKELFSLMYKSLSETYARYLNHVVKTLGFVLLSIGWVLTSVESRIYLRENRTALIAALITIGIMAFIHTKVSISFYFSSKNITKLLSKLEYIGDEYFNNYSISKNQLGINLFMILTIFSMLFLLILFLKP